MDAGVFDLDGLHRQNPHWTGGSLPLPDRLIERPQLDEMRRWIGRSVVILQGMRQVGKTTILRHFATGLDVEPKRILHFSFTGKEEKGTIRKLVDMYLSEILRESLHEVTSTVYILLDEVQTVAGWSDDVKGYVDLTDRLRFVCTGSSAVNLTSGAGESLLGRCQIIHANPFSFREYLLWKGAEDPGPGPSLEGAIRTEMDLSGEVMGLHFRDYLEMGGLPGVYDIKNRLDRASSIRMILDLAIFRDIATLFEVRAPQTVRRLFDHIASTSGQRMNLASISSDLNVKYETLMRYIEALELSGLISRSGFNTGSPSKRSRKQMKVYTGDHAFLISHGTPEGLSVETVVHSHLRMNLKGRGGSVSYWYDGKGREVDAIGEVDGWVMAAESKYTPSVSLSDAKGLLAFMKDRTLNVGFIVSRSTFNTMKDGDRTIHILPAWAFCLWDHTSRGR